MVKKFKHKDEIYDKLTNKSQQEQHAKIKKQKSRGNCEKFEEMQSSKNEKITRRALEASIKVGISSWSATLPIKKYGLSG